MSTPFDRHEMVRICREHGIGREAFLKVKPLVLAAAERGTRCNKRPHRRAAGEQR